jgi:hypothetical protein
MRIFFFFQNYYMFIIFDNLMLSFLLLPFDQVFRDHSFVEIRCLIYLFDDMMIEKSKNNLLRS